MYLDLTLNYVLLTEDPKGFFLPLFMGYTTNSFGLNRLMFAALSLPPSLVLINKSRLEIAKLRAMGVVSTRAFPLNIGQLPKLRSNPISPLTIIMSSKALDDEAHKKLGSLPFPTLHLRSADVDRIIECPFHGQMLIREYAAAVAATLPPTSSDLLLIHRLLGEEQFPDPQRIISFTKSGHGVTILNETPVELSGGKYLKENKLIAPSEGPYIAAIKESVDSLLTERERILGEMEPMLRSRSVDLIIACPGIFHHLNNADRLKKYLQKYPSQAKKAFKIIAGQKSYYNICTEQEFSNFQNNPFFHALLDLWMNELSLFTAALTFQSTNNFCPVIRLPRRLYQNRGLVSILGTLLRSGNSKSRSINIAARKMINAFTKELAAPYSQYLEGHNKQIRFCCDLPLGLTVIEDLSIALRHCVTYLPPTPGNNFLISSMVSDPILLNISDKLEVLVVRSFKPDDPLKPLLEYCIKEYSLLSGWDLKVNFVDVHTEDDFIKAINNFAGGILIFDGHGSHRSETQIGSIRIGDQDLDVWGLRRRVRIPPIIILSCCDGFPGDRSHASTATGFLTLGAISVLSAIFPIDGRDAGLFVARLLFRITSTAPSLIRTSNTAISWAEIITSQCRASFVSQLIGHFILKGNLSEETAIKISYDVIVRINCFDSEWFDCLLESVSSAIGWERSVLKRFLQNDFSFPQALYYVQLGYPDRILFMLTDHPDSGDEAN